MSGQSPFENNNSSSQHLPQSTGYEACLSQLYCSVQHNLQPWEINVKEVFKFLDSEALNRRPFDYTDPVYGRVKLSSEMLDLIDTAPLRRLGAVSQMTVGMTSKGQGIDHTRLTHSIGVSILGDRMADHLGLDRHERNTLKVCGLLHDIRHGPFSHLYDHMTIDGVYFDHDSRSIDFLKEPGLELALRGLGLTPEEIFANLTDKREGSNQLALPLGYLAKEVLDRVDYLRRDTAGAKFIPSDCLRAIEQTCEDLLQVLEYNRDENLIVCREEDLEVVRRFNMWRGFAFQVLPFDRATQVVNAFIRREADRSFAHMTPEERNVFLKESTSYTDQQFMEKFSPDSRRILRSGNFEQNFAVLNIIKAETLTPHGVEQLRVHPTLHLIRQVCGPDFCANFDPLVVRRPKPASSVTFNVQSNDGYIEARSVQPLALPEELEDMTHGHLKPGRIPHGCDSSEVMVVCYKGHGNEAELIRSQFQIQKGLIDKGLIKPKESTIAALDTLTPHKVH
jgi:HD superfamily phosphohydrolase